MQSESSVLSERSESKDILTSPTYHDQNKLKATETIIARPQESGAPLGLPDPCPTPARAKRLAGPPAALLAVPSTPNACNKSPIQTDKTRSQTRYPRMPYTVYLLRCTDGSIYVGHTSNLKRRLQDHSSANAAGHTKWHKPRRLLYTEQFETRSDACRRERQIKKWSRAKKEALAAGDLQRLHTLSKRRQL